MGVGLVDRDEILNGSINGIGAGSNRKYPVRDVYLNASIKSEEASPIIYLVL